MPDFPNLGLNSMNRNWCCGLLAAVVLLLAQSGQLAVEIGLIPTRVTYIRAIIGAGGKVPLPCNLLSAQPGNEIDDRTLRLQGRALLAWKCYSQTERLLQTLSNSRTLDTFSRLWLGWAVAEQERWSEAVMIWNEDAITSRVVVKMLVGLGEKAEAAGDLSGAEQIYKTMAQLESPQNSAFLLLGRVYLHQDRLEEAVAVAEEAVRNNEASDYYDYSPYSLLGELYLRLGRPYEALSNLRTAAILNHEDYWVKSNLAQALIEVGSPGQAVEILLPLTQNHPEFFTYYRLGLAYLDLGLPEEAIVWLQDAVAKNTDSIEAKGRLGQAYCLAGQSEEGIKWLNVSLVVKAPEWIKVELDHCQSGNDR